MKDSYSNASSNGTDEVKTSNWARHSVQSWIGNVGSAMSESSGIFTFPSTGIYMVHHTVSGYCSGGGRTYLGMRQYYSTDGGSSYNIASSGYANGYQNTAHFMGSGTVYYDVSNTSNNKIKFNIEVSDTSQIFGSSSNKNTGVVFLRIGDT